MKSITTLTLLAGVTFGAPSYADIEWNKAEPIKMAHESSSEEKPSHVTDAVDAKHEALQKFVNDALEAHEKKAPEEMKGRNEEMKAYVAKALKTQQEADTAEILSKLAVWKKQYSPAQIEAFQKKAQAQLGGVEPYAMNRQEAMEYVIAWQPLGLGLDPEDVAEVDSCFRPGVATDQCIYNSITAWTIATDFKFLPLSLEYNCTAANCQNPAFRSVCMLVDDSSIVLPKSLVQNCLAQ